MAKKPHAKGGDIRDMGSIPDLGRSPGGEHGSLLQKSYLESPMNRGAWWAVTQKSIIWVKTVWFN